MYLVGLTGVSAAWWRASGGGPAQALRITCCFDALDVAFALPVDASRVCRGQPPCWCVAHWLHARLAGLFGLPARPPKRCGMSRASTQLWHASSDHHHLCSRKPRLTPSRSLALPRWARCGSASPTCPSTCTPTTPRVSWGMPEDAVVHGCKGHCRAAKGTLMGRTCGDARCMSGT